MGERRKVIFLVGCVEMSNSENISLWKKKAEIDYIPLFMSLWLSLNAWMKDRYIETKDRKLLDLLKSSEGLLKDKFSSLIDGASATSNTFKGFFSECYRALEDANLQYDKLPQSLENEINKKISFSNCITDWNNGNPSFTSIIRAKSQQGKIEIDTNLWITNDNNQTFAAYIECLYQVRCLLFHGKLTPKHENERVIRAFYLTLSMIMEQV